MIRAQLTHAVREEMAKTAEDLVWRRTELGGRGSASATVLSEAAAPLDERRARVTSGGSIDVRT